MLYLKLKIGYEIFCFLFKVRDLLGNVVDFRLG